MFDFLAEWDPQQLAVISAGLVALAFVLLFFGRRRQADLVGLFGGGPKPIPPRSASAPIDLSKPIRGEEAWAAIRAAASDEQYQFAVETVRKRFGDNVPSMRLPVLLRTTMDRDAISFRDAMIRIAETPAPELGS